MPHPLKKTGLVFFPAFDWAISANHPEREERLLYTQDQVMEEGLLDFPNIFEFKPGIATYDQINRCHICVPNPQNLTTHSHLISAGGAITAARKYSQALWITPLPWFVRPATIPCWWRMERAVSAISISKPS